MYGECARLAALTLSEREQAEARVQAYFERLTKIPGVTSLTEYYINVRGASPVRHCFRRLSPKIMEVVQAEISKLKEKAIFEESVSDWCSGWSF